MLISGMGELHLEVLVARITTEFKVDANIGNPQVSYRETITKKIDHTERFSKTVAGKENFAEITLRLAPAKNGEGNSYHSALDEEILPREFLDAVERGVTGSFTSGILYGYPAFDIEATLIGAQIQRTHRLLIRLRGARLHGL